MLADITNNGDAVLTAKAAATAELKSIANHCCNQFVQLPPAQNQIQAATNQIETAAGANSNSTNQSCSSSRSAAAAVATVDDFRAVRTIGTGFFGRVLLVRHKGTEQFHAMKVLRKDQVVQHGQARRVMNEKHILQALNFPFIVGMNYAFQDTRNLFLVLEFVNGGDMYSYLRRHCRASEEVVRFIAAQLCLALEYLHFYGVLHRDLKPENILFDARGYLKLTDFGLARVLPAAGRAYSRCGTLDYLAPEVLSGQGYAKGVDWWALGVCTAEAIAGVNPFAGANQQETYENIVHGRLNLPDWFSPCLVDFVSCLLHPQEALRHGSVHSGSAADARKHPWFAGLNWAAVYHRRAQSPVVVDQPCHSGDARNFLFFEEDQSLLRAFEFFGSTSAEDGTSIATTDYCDNNNYNAINDTVDDNQLYSQFDQYFLNF